MSRVRTLCYCHNLLHWLHFIAYVAFCVLAYVVIDDDSVVFVIANIACVISDVEIPASPKLYGVKENYALWRGGGKNGEW